MKLPFIGFKSSDEAYRQITKVVNSIDDGHISATGAFTLTISVVSTVITNVLCHADSVILLMPTTANAAAELATLYIVPTKGSFLVNHANNAQSDRTFSYIIIG